MTNDDKALVERLRYEGYLNSDNGDWGLRNPNGPEAADRIEALSAEVERRTIDGIHTCHDECQRVACVLRRENKRLREALELADAALRGANMNMSVVERKIRAALENSND